MKALCRFFPAESLEWTQKTTGEIKRGWLQKYDLDMGPGMRVLQSEVMRMNQGQILAPGEYEVDFYLEKDRRNLLQVVFLNTRMVKPDQKPQAVNG